MIEFNRADSEYIIIEESIGKQVDIKMDDTAWFNDRTWKYRDFFHLHIVAVEIITQRE